MDHQDYWAIAEADIEIQNPVTDRKLRLLDDYCDIRDGMSVLDIGCGKAWVMRQWAERFAIEGTGLEINPAFLEVARRKLPARGRLQFIEA
ncbi:MAG: class I SAM-dependent methyltransferase, partial [Devosia sp.]|nr:class I SAM-dependent methyltransferase [Devosia sp.]